MHGFQFLTVFDLTISKANKGLLLLVVVYLWFTHVEVFVSSFPWLNFLSLGGDNSAKVRL